MLSALRDLSMVHLWDALLRYVDLNALINCSVALGIARVVCVTKTDDLARLRDVAVRLDGSLILFFVHVADWLLFTEHAVVILGNRVLIARLFTPVYLTSAHVQLSLVQTLMAHDRVSQRNLAHHNVRLGLVSIVIGGN